MMPSEKNPETSQEISAPKRLLQELESIYRELESNTENTIKQLEIHTERNELIREIDEAILRATFSPKEVFDLIIERCLPKTGAQHGQMVLYRQNQLTVVASTEPDRIGQTLPLHASLCGKAVLEEKPQHIADVSQLPAAQYVRYHNDTQSEYVVLIKPQVSNRVLGVIDLERSERGLFDSTSVAFAELLARQTAIAIGHTQTWSGIRTLYEISTSLLSGEVRLETGYQRILEAILEEFDFEHGQILRLVEDEFVIIASSRKEDVGLRPGKDTSVCGRYLIAEENREILVIPDIRQSPYAQFYLGLLQAAGGEPMVSEMIVPLIHNNRLMGALNIESPRPGVFSDLERNLLGLISGLIATAISATLARATSANRGRVQTATLAMAHLGSVAQSFLHHFGNSIGDARGKLGELKEHLAKSQVPPIRTDNIPVSDFLGMVTGKLTEAKEILDDFSNRFNPRDPRFLTRNMDMEHVARMTVDRAKSRYSSLPIDFQFESRAPEEARVSSKLVCYLSEQVYEVLSNFLDNAVEAILEKKSSDERGRIIVVLELQDAFHVRLQISDNGIGIPEEVLPRIFEYGFSTRKDARGSHGIGLWFCELYISQTGGEIQVDTVPGQGTTFTVILPTAITYLEL